MKKMTFFPVDWILLFKHLWILKTFQLTLEGVDQRFPNFFKSYIQICVW